MGAKTPKNVREKVLKLWLSGLKRDEVARKAGVSVGNVLNIVEESKKEIPDIILLRKVAVEIRKKGWNMDGFASAVRHRNILSNLLVTDEQIDDLIEDIQEHCYKKQIPVPSFLSKIHNQSLTSKIYGVSITELDDLIAKKESYLENLGIQLAELDAKYITKLKRENLTESELVKIRQDRPYIDTIAKQRQEIDKLKTREMDKMFKEVRKISESVLSNPGWDYHQVKRASDLLQKNPLQLKKEIESILKKEPSLYNTSYDEDT